MMRITIPQHQVPQVPGIFRPVLKAMAIRFTDTEVEIDHEKFQQVQERVSFLLHQEHLACCRLCASHAAGVCSADGKLADDHARKADCPRRQYNIQREQEEYQRRMSQHQPADRAEGVMDRPPVTAAQVATFAQAFVTGRYVPDSVRMAREAICRGCEFQKLDSKGVPWCSICGCGTSNAQKQIRNLAAYEENLPKWGCKHPRRKQGEGWARIDPQAAPAPAAPNALTEWEKLPDWKKNRTPKPVEPPVVEPAVRQPAPFFLSDERPVYLPNLYRGRSAFLICGGPSFAQLDHSLLRQPGIITMAVNNAAKTFRPNLWTHVDAADHFLRSIFEDPGIQKFCPWNNRDNRIFDSSTWQWADQAIRDCPNVLFYKRHTGFVADRFLSTDSFCWGNDAKDGGARSVMLVAIRVLYELGFRQVFLLGADFTMSADTKYHFDQDRAPGSISGNNYTYKVLNERFLQLRPLFEKAGFRIYNCNPESHLTAFDYVPYGDAVEVVRGPMRGIVLACERTAGLYDEAKPPVPKLTANAGVPPARGMPYPLLKWAPLQYPGQRCAMTGCNAKHQWLLTWWYANLRRTNPDLPIVFVDKGMDDAGRAWCQQRGMLVSVQWKDHIMFAKPMGIIQSPFAETMWLDPDCEVRGSLDGAFEIPRSELAAVYDTPTFMGPNHIQAGMVIAKHGSQEALRWASLCAWGFACRSIIEDRKNVCDQAVLNWVADQNPSCMTILPQNWNWVRGLGRNLQATVFHWTGPLGKKRIARLMERRHYDATPREPSHRAPVGSSEACAVINGGGDETVIACES